MATMAAVLSEDNQALLRVIRDAKPKTLTELATLSGRQVPNLSRTLRMMAGYGLVELKRRRGNARTRDDRSRHLPRVRHAPAGRGRMGVAPHAIGEQRTFTNGRIIVAGGKVRRGKQKRADYLLYYRRDFPLAVVEAKEIGLPAETGVQQAREYAEILGLKFAYATNGHRIIEIDYTTGTEREVDRYATPTNCLPA
jgi:hypothetical protein